MADLEFTKCNRCGAEWKTNKTITVCPFCGAELYSKLEKQLTEQNGDLIFTQEYTFFTLSEDIEAYFETEDTFEDALQLLKKGRMEDLDRAYQVFENLARTENSGDAMFYCGECLMKKETAEETKRAVLWYTKSSAAGYAEASLALGNLYAAGKYVSKNVKHAQKYYEKAAAAGNEQAIKILEKIKEETKAKEMVDAGQYRLESNDWAFSQTEVKPQDVVAFGKVNGRPIHWIVLEKKDNMLLLGALNPLAVGDYKNARMSSGDLIETEMDKLYHKLFDAKEIPLIQRKMIAPLFCFSKKQYELFFPGELERKFTVDNTLLERTDYIAPGYCWLRTGADNGLADVVSAEGKFSTQFRSNGALLIRPAMWMKPMWQRME